ncbi:hypothetical protein CKAH01_10444 [Colletotrichum kahawae]|uniref:Uncharacterized protein n=1 Tax=Colletotrichum kahawae TaxID=34407 RepID=A0AAD9XX56_COLKA|nr:hypothetical protein CKAH01_10444 [Colletotrichum kahawae]
MQNDLLQTGYQAVGCVKKHTTGKTLGVRHNHGFSGVQWPSGNNHHIAAVGPVAGRKSGQVGEGRRCTVERGRSEGPARSAVQTSRPHAPMTTNSFIPPSAQSTDAMSVPKDERQEWERGEVKLSVLSTGGGDHSTNDFAHAGYNRSKAFGRVLRVSGRGKQGPEPTSLQDQRIHYAQHLSVSFNPLAPRAGPLDFCCVRSWADSQPGIPPVSGGPLQHSSTSFQPPVHLSVSLHGRGVKSPLSITRLSFQSRFHLPRSGIHLKFTDSDRNLTPVARLR